MCERAFFSLIRNGYRSIAAVVVLSSVCCVLMGFGGTARAFAQQPPHLSIEQIDVGIGGYYKVGRWTPVTVRVKVDVPCRIRWSIEVPDPHGNRTIVWGSEQELPSAGVHSLTTNFKTGRLQGSLRCRLEWSDPSGERPVWRLADERTLRAADPVKSPGSPLLWALKQSNVLVATLGKPAGYVELPALIKAIKVLQNEALQNEALLQDEALRVVELKDVSQLPADYSAYDGLDVLAINGPQQLTAQQSHAVRDWVRTGGHLAVSVGGGEVTAIQEGNLYEWLGDLIPLEGTRQLRQLGGFENLAGKYVPIRIPRSRPVSAATIRLTPAGARKNRDKTVTSGFDGEVLVSELRKPLVLRRPFAFGQITFFGVDLHQPPLADWEPLSDVILKLVFPEFHLLDDSSRSRQGRLTQTGISDLATQLQFSLEDFPDVRRVSSWTVMALLLLYLAVIGPVDYFLVRRLFHNPWCTWLTFPLMVAVAATLAVWTAARTNGRELQLNQVDLIDINADSPPSEPQFVRMQTWMTVYSPNTQRNRVTIVPQRLRTGTAESPPDSPSVPKDQHLASSRFRLSWSGIPEDSFGGMYRLGGLDFGRPTYQYAEDLAGIDDLPISIWSTESLTAARFAQAETVVESALSSRGFGLLSGTFRHHLSGPLRDWMLAYGPGVYLPVVNPRTGEPPAIEPGQFWSPDDSRQVRRRELEDFLTQTRTISVKQRTSSGSTEYRPAQTEYDPFARAPSDILRMITFYRRAGGRQYTRLDNDVLRQLDFSSLIDLDRAVLFARIDRPAAELKLNGHTLKAKRHSTFVRIVLPVQKRR